MPNNYTRRTIERMEAIKSALSNGVYSISKLAKMLNLSHIVVYYITSILTMRGEIYCATYGRSVRLCASSKDVLDSTLRSIIDLLISTAVNSGAASCKSKCCSILMPAIVNGMADGDIRYAKLVSALYRIGVPVTSKIQLSGFLIALFRTYLGDSITIDVRSRRTRVNLCNHHSELLRPLSFGTVEVIDKTGLV